ncbi:MAG: hypothetical protein ACYCWE_17405 [Eubacteriales bacterium]
MKKNAPIAIRAIAGIQKVFNTIDKAANADIIVPIIPTNKYEEFLHKHLIKAYDWNTAAKNTPASKNIKASTPNPNAIQTAVVINGIKHNAYNTPTITPAKTLIIKPKKLQTLIEFSLLHSIFFISYFLYELINSIL